MGRTMYEKGSKGCVYMYLISIFFSGSLRSLVSYIHIE